MSKRRNENKDWATNGPRNETKKAYYENLCICVLN